MTLRAVDPTEVVAASSVCYPMTQESAETRLPIIGPLARILHFSMSGLRHPATNGHTRRSSRRISSPGFGSLGQDSPGAVRQIDAYVCGGALTMKGAEEALYPVKAAKGPN